MTATLLLALGLFAAAPTAAATAGGPPPLRVVDAWVREAPPAAQVQAAYGTFCNDGDAPLTLTGLSSETFRAIEMHTTIETADSARMERLQNVRIEAGQCVTFAPGGRHFMLFDPDRTLRAGDEVAFELLFADERTQSITFAVRRGGENRNDEHGNHHGH